MSADNHCSDPARICDVQQRISIEEQKVCAFSLLDCTSICVDAEPLASEPRCSLPYLSVAHACADHCFKLIMKRIPIPKARYGSIRASQNRNAGNSERSDKLSIEFNNVLKMLCEPGPAFVR